MHGPKLVSGAPVILFSFELLFDWFSLGWGNNFPFPFSAELVGWLTRGLGRFWYLGTSRFELIDFGSEGDDLLLLFCTCPPSTEQKEAGIFILAFVHEDLWVINATIAFPVPSSILDEVFKFLTIYTCVRLEQVV
jgi:hypothetical protein